MWDDMQGRGTSVWRWPVVLAIVTLVGLLSALLADGAGDVLSWIALGLPVAICAVFGPGWRRRDR